MTSQKTAFITGITGNQGSAVARHLLKNNYSVIGLTRNANSDKAQQLKADGITLVEGDLNHPDSYQDKFNKVDSIFLVQALQGKQNEIKQGKTFIDQMSPDKKTHLVYASVLGADLNTGVPHFESKYELENYIKSKGLNYTILRPASFYENHLMPQVANGIKKGKYVTPLKPDCNQQMISVDHIGKIAAKVIRNENTYQGKTLDLATDEWQIKDIPTAFAEVLKRPVKYGKLPGIITRLAMGKDLYKMFAYMNK
ncbi:MAG: NmrA/HSCARG family protein, partial [Winogradskyella sp.]|nr:NmrA/HSCARG family protein [Winogradskyella sp.]